MTALMISTITVTDPEGFQTYLAKSRAIAQPYGAKMLFRGRTHAALAGAPVAGTMVVIAEFPDIEALQRWNTSPEYEEIVALRESCSEQVMTAYDMMD